MPLPIPDSLDDDPLTNVSPLAKYARDWLTQAAAAEYARSREPDRFRHYELEQRLVGRWLRLCEPGAVVLDSPCGTGRFSKLVAECGHRLLRADLSYNMVAYARQAGPNECVVGNLCLDLGSPPLKPGSVDVVLLWRLFHHCKSDADRELMLRSARLLARRYVILSFYSRASVTYWARRLVRAALRREPKGQGAIWTSSLRRLADDVGLQLVDLHPYSAVSINSAACFRVR